MSNATTATVPATTESSEAHIDFDFTNKWFEAAAKDIWNYLIPRMMPRKILEIGSYEGASVCYLIGRLAHAHPLEIHCLDTWEGSSRHKDAGIDMAAVETRFHRNTQTAMRRAAHGVRLAVHKGRSDLSLAKLISENLSGYFDLIYIDGSHEAADVLADAVMSFKLLKVGGMMIFDDYLWAENPPSGADPLRCPKLAIDAFTNCNFRKIRIHPVRLYQLYVEKVAN
jgi:predicted O-methyltransferase YrrM